ncbi:MAG: IS30 family transposase [Bifidobacterium breve]|nr:IS30 family transposase [Bifidobacterium breve]
MRPRSAGRSDATRGSRPARANRTGRAGPGGPGRVRGRAAATWPGPRAAGPCAARRLRVDRGAWRRAACGRGSRSGRAGAGRRRRYAGASPWSIPVTPVTRCRPETVCRRTYADKARRERWARCPHARRRRRRKAGGGRVGRSRIPLRTSICERPYGQDDGNRFGEREADGVIGAGRSLHTEVERRTRFPMAAIAPDKTAAASVAAQKAMFSRPPAAARTGATHDDGAELARHAELRDEPGMAAYFADPYSSWRRGGNENRNGMIRRYPPRRTPIAPPWHANCRRSSTKPTTGPCECSASAPPPRHSPTNRQNQPRTRIIPYKHTDA